MIGVLADPADGDIIDEFFELFKTPWEFYRENRLYDVLLSDGSVHIEVTGKLTILYAGRKTRFDDEYGTRIDLQPIRSRKAEYRGTSLPIYGDSVAFPGVASGLLKDEESQRSLAYVYRSREKVLARIGYDLFAEVRTLLSEGQPAANASVPALDLHIALLREMIVGSGLSLAEIPPVPDGYRFIACLTHDVDHPSLRKHGWDHTTFGFLYRATVGSVSRFLRGRLSIREVCVNWFTALKLPLIHLGLARDIWRDFDQRYLQLEQGLASTFFVIPFANRPGSTFQSSAPKRRAAGYGAADLADSIQRLAAAGCEVALHGIDAWHNSSHASEELQEVRRLTRRSEIGVRMHWLYYDRQSPLALEAAGAAYDSTVGYNETVGYRAGTTQAFKPAGAARLLELPLHVMDTALFYPAYLGLSPQEAKAVLDRMVEHAVQVGGCLTINWHDRSVAPERLWDGSYRDLVQHLRDRGAWFATASDAVAWFRRRRSVVFKTDSIAPGGVAAMPTDAGSRLPGFRLRLYNTPESRKPLGPEEYADASLDGRVQDPISCGVTE